MRTVREATANLEAFEAAAPEPPHAHAVTGAEREQLGAASFFV